MAPPPRRRAGGGLAALAVAAAALASAAAQQSVPAGFEEANPDPLASFVATRVGSLAELRAAVNQKRPHIVLTEHILLPDDNPNVGGTGSVGGIHLPREVLSIRVRACLCACPCACLSFPGLGRLHSFVCFQLAGQWQPVRGTCAAGGFCAPLPHPRGMSST